MRHSKWLLGLVAVLLALGTALIFGGATTTTARGQDVGGAICGTITSTVVITRDAWLACDVQCEEVDTPCIQFGRSNIKLSLNGFTLRGPANPPNIADCAALPPAFPPADGIHASGLSDVVVEGPGLVERMRRHGIALVNSTKSVVKKLTSHQNCYSGVFLFEATNSLIEEVVSVKNSAASRHLPCGGLCITNSHNNRIRRSEFAGNGSTVSGVTTFAFCPVAVPNDFGVGLPGNSSGNVIEENGMGGNINGLFVCPGASGNLILKNVIAGNPPMQVSASPGVDPAPDPVGADIRDFSPAGANTFRENLCITYTGPTPSSCLRAAVGIPGLVPNLPQYAGHQNN